MAILRKLIVKELTCKRVRGQQVVGSMFASLVEYYVDALNSPTKTRSFQCFVNQTQFDREWNLSILLSNQPHLGKDWFFPYESFVWNFAIHHEKWEISTNGGQVRWFCRTFSNSFVKVLSHWDSKYFLICWLNKCFYLFKLNKASVFWAIPQTIELTATMSCATTSLFNARGLVNNSVNFFYFIQWY